MYSLLSYNIKFGERLPEIQAWLETLSPRPQILCFQEFPKSAMTRFVREFGNGQFAGEYVPVFARNGEAYGQLTLFDKNTFRNSDTRVILLGENIPEKRLAKRLFQVDFLPGMQRAALVTQLQTDTTSLLIVNAHLSVYATNRYRRSQLQRVLRSVQHAPRVLLLGDLNYATWIGGTQLGDWLQPYGFTHCTAGLKTHRFFFLKHQLDYIFSKNCLVVETTVSPVRFSDHYPLLMRLDLTAQTNMESTRSTEEILEAVSSTV